MIRGGYNFFFNPLPLEHFTRVVVEGPKPVVDITFVLLIVAVVFALLAAGLRIAALVLNHNHSKESFACEATEDEVQDA